MFNPYPEGYYASPGDEIVDFKLDYNTDSFRCGRIREDYVVTLENRKRAPPTKIGDVVRAMCTRAILIAHVCNIFFLDWI